VELLFELDSGFTTEELLDGFELLGEGVYP
jgi:hypothetical protein